MAVKCKLRDETEKNLPHEVGKEVESEMLPHEIESELRESLDELENLKAKIIPIADWRA